MMYVIESKKALEKNSKRAKQQQDFTDDKMTLDSIPDTKSL